MVIIMYAFNMQQHRSLYGAKVETPAQLYTRLAVAIKKGAEVISIRIYK